MCLSREYHMFLVKYFLQFTIKILHSSTIHTIAVMMLCLVYMTDIQCKRLIPLPLISVLYDKKGFSIVNHI